MLWNWWSSLSNSQQMAIVQVVPMLVFVLDLVLKGRFGLDLSTAGADLCLAAISLDVSQTFSAMSSPQLPANAGTLFGGLMLAHLVVWVSSLSIVPAGLHSAGQKAWVALSYCLGLLALYTSLGTVVQRMLL